MPTFVNPKTGNCEVWASKPTGYITLEQHMAARSTSINVEEVQYDVITNLKVKLQTIDIASIRSLRAIDNGTDTQYDHQKLIELEQRATDLRKQLSELDHE